MKKLMFFLLLLFPFVTLLTGCNDNDTLNFIKFKKHTLISVSVYGHVKQEGTYLVARDIKISDLENKFNGYLANAEKLAQNSLIKDKTIFFINSKRIKNKIQLNTCRKEDLLTIKGIGSSIADKILKYRQEHGDFKSLIDLKNVKGIKDKLFQKIYEYLTL